MIDSNNILLITDDYDTEQQILDKLVLLRENDNITVCGTKNVKKQLENSLYCVVILHEITDNQEATLKLIKTIKEIKKDAEVLLLLNDINAQLIVKAYDCGIYDYFTTDADDYEIVIKTVNCFKLRTLNEIAQRNQKFLTQLGAIDSKTELYQYNYLKEVFIDLSNDLRIQNGVFAILTIDEKTKTKVSTNRLAITIKNSVRRDDIVASARGGKFYLVLPNIDMTGATAVIQKIQDKMSKDLPIRCGLNKIGIKSFSTLDKITQDSLLCASQNEKMCVSLLEDNTCTEQWLENNENVQPDKNFKLFEIAFSNKLKNVITPLFYRFEKEYQTKLTNTEVSQYANIVESVFSLKNENLHSELIIRYNGFAKFKIEILHSGLDSEENTKIELPLNGLTEKELTKLLKQLKDEYKKTAFAKGE